MNSLNDPSFMIESTPVVATAGINNNRDLAGIKNKKLSRLALDKNFSPIVFQVPRTPPPYRPKVAPEASQRQVNEVASLWRILINSGADHGIYDSGYLR